MKKAKPAPVHEPRYRRITLGVDPVECPKCGKAAVPYPDGTTKCMYCDYGWPPKTAKGERT